MMPVKNPGHWQETAVLGDMAEIVSGITKGRKITGVKTREVPYLAVANVQDQELNLDLVKSIEATEEEIERYRLSKDDLLLTEGGDPDKLGRGTLWNNERPECIHQNHIFRVRLTSKDLDPRFLIRLMSSQWGKQYFLRAAKQTTGIASINMTQLRGFPLLIPPLTEQRRIAAILDQAEALRAKRRRALDRLEIVTQSIFQEMFGQDPRHNPLRELIDEFRYGTSNKSSQAGYPALRIPNVVNNILDLSDLKMVPVTESEFGRLQLRDGDLLFVRTNGNPNNVGRSAIFDSSIVASTGLDPKKFVFASYLIRCRLKEKTILPIVLQVFLSSTKGRQEMRERCKTSAGQFNINVEGLSEISIPVPAMALQKRFAAQVAVVERLKTAQRASLDKLDQLFASLQHRAFRGELTAPVGNGQLKLFSAS